jgi:hypothetical protein
MTRKLPIPAREDLIRVYQMHRSISKTAREFGTTNPTVRRWLINYGIDRYSHQEAFNFDLQSKKADIPLKEELEFLYSNTSIKDIEKMFSVSQKTVYEWLAHHSIPILDFSEKLINSKQKSFTNRFFMSKETIEADYRNAGSIGVLASRYNCSVSTVRKLLYIHDIQTIFPKVSVGQDQIASFVRSLGLDVDLNDRKIIYPFELDIVIPEKSLAIEYCGNYYHSETWGGKSRNYHLNKHLSCQKNGIDLITIFESDWNTKKDIITSVLSHKLGKTTNKLFAKNTTFEVLSYNNVRDFENDNHLQGSRPAQNYYGLTYNNELVMTMSIGKSRFNPHYENEMIRMTTKKGYSVVGGLTKLFKNAGVSSCVTYSDRRWGEGRGYLNAGFNLVGSTQPNYFYFHKSNHDKLYPRTTFQKSRIRDVDMTKTEYQNMLDRGYDRIWDCGNNIYGFGIK